MNLSLGLRPVIISNKMNKAWPPSNAGIGNTFMKAKMIENTPVKVQNLSQSQKEGKVFPILIKLPKESFGFTFPVKICLMP